MTFSKWMTGAALAASLSVAAAAAQPQDRAEAALRAAMEKETVEGDLKGAIDQYKKLAQGANKPVAARALVRLGECYEKQGNADARKTYEQVLSKFGDQKDAVAAARARLAAMGGVAGGTQPRTRMLWDDVPGWTLGPSPDGRWIASLDFKQTGGLAVRDLATGESRVLKQGIGEGVNGTIVSPDGKWIAFYWWQWDGKKGSGAEHSLRIMRADGTGERTLFDVGKKEDYYIYLYSWSPDGKWIAAMQQGQEDYGAILISTETGERRPLGVGDQWLFTAKFSPDGQWLAVRTPMPRAAATRVSVLAVNRPDSQVINLVDDAVLVGWTPDGQGILFTRMRNDAIEMFLLPVAQGKAAGEPRKLPVPLDSAEVPVAVTSGGSFLYQSVHTGMQGVVADVDLEAAKLGKVVATQASEILGKDGGGTQLSPDGSRAFFTLPRRALLIRSLASGSEHTITPQMAAYVEVTWAGDGRSLILGGLGKDGYGLYRVDAETGATALLDGNHQRGYRTLTPSPDGGVLFYLKTRYGTELESLEFATGSLRKYPSKGFPRIRDMRVSRDGRKLAIFGSSGVEVMEVATGQTREILDDGTGCWGGDWSPDNRSILTTCGVWNKPSELVRIPVDGGAPVKTPLSAHYRHLRLSPDGKTVSLTEFNDHRQLWVLENFLPGVKVAVK